MTPFRASASPRHRASDSLAAPDFDLEATLGCGQVFHWAREGVGFLGTIGEQPVYVEQRGADLWTSAGVQEVVRHYFALDHPLAEIYASFPSDPAMQAALAFCRGMRIVRQPAWECLATFITSSMKQVAHIAQISHLLRRRFGRRLEWPGRELFAYPSPEALARLDEADLRACALGYRAKNLLGTARMIAAGEVDLGRLAQLEDAAARAELCRLPGVGEKVANCALLFGFERVQAFPIDVWIERVLRQIYFPRKRKVTAKRLREFSADHFGPFGGYAQQYLFHHARKTWTRERRGGGKING
ncbi:MAG: N-glycosylase/DNA lyase [Chthoniobacter sp.]|jgi:N-glycosylase/DNA lyase|nr:N-glycosylase/DNA lyase [Chthoniobacter sp.]